MSNDSSYSVAIGDGVNIILVENSHSDNETKSVDYMHELSDTSNTFAYSQNESSKMRSFTFEAQVGSLKN